MTRAQNNDPEQSVKNWQLEAVRSELTNVGQKVISLEGTQSSNYNNIKTDIQQQLKEYATKEHIDHQFELFEVKYGQYIQNQKRLFWILLPLIAAQIFSFVSNLIAK